MGTTADGVELAHMGEREDRRGCAMIGCRRRGGGKAVLAIIALRHIHILIIIYQYWYSMQEGSVTDPPSRFAKKPSLLAT
jgi:hypothetical protein